MKNLFLPLALALCLLLAACGDHPAGEEGAPAENGAPAGQMESTPPDVSPPPEEGGAAPEPVELGPLTVEVVASSQGADALLPLLGDLSTLLDGQLDRLGYDVEAVTVTLSTAGGVTADALAAGGVDVALLPVEDFLLHEGSAAGVLMDGGEIPSDVAAVASGKAALDASFQEALAAALTGGGEESFLALCRPGVTYVPFDGEALQPIRNQLAEETQGGAAAPQ